MKKIIGLIAIVAVVFTLTMTVNTSNEKTEGLSDMIAYTIADAAEAAADIDPVWGCKYTGNFFDRCYTLTMTVANCVSGFPTSCGVIRIDKELALN